MVELASDEEMARLRRLVGNHSDGRGWEEAW